jgi:hypothetical protein
VGIHPTKNLFLDQHLSFYLAASLHVIAVEIGDPDEMK